MTKPTTVLNGLTPRVDRGVTPDSCSSLTGCPGGDHCKQCSHALYFGEVYANGRRWAFEFSPMFGPVFTKADGEPKAVQPSEKHPAWDKWQEWYEGRFGA